MNVVYYLGFALFGAIAFALGRRIAAAGTRPALASYGVVLALLLIKAVLNHNPPWEFALFGSWPDYIFVQSYLIFPIGLACLGLAAGLLPSGRNRRAVTVLAGFLVLVSLWTERWMFVAPDSTSTRRADADHHITQSTVYSCGPAACVSLLSLLGVEATEGEMMALCRTPTYGGTSLFRICRGLTLKLGDGYRVRIVEGDPALLRARDAPAIVSVRRIHVVTLRFTADGVVVLDPGKSGPKTITFDECVERYGGPAVIVDAVPRSGS